MNRMPPWRLGGALLCLLLLPVCAFLFSGTPPTPEDTFLGVRVLTDDGGHAQPVPRDLLERICLNGAPVAADAETATLYLSVRPGAPQGMLSVSGGALSLAFARDDAFADLEQAIAQGHAFTLLIRQADGARFACRAVLTPLPVLRIDSDGGSDLSDPYAEHAARVSIWEPDDGGRPARVSPASWHRRGMTSLLFKKGSLKLSLQNEFGRKRGLSIAGLGKDDDWLLNSMGQDDLKLREKLLQDLWNTMQAPAADPLPMSAGEYAELVLDGEYMGLYLLQRRVDAKYLNLKGKKAILLKGSNVSSPQSAAEGFTIRSSPLTDASTLAQAGRLYDMRDLSGADLESWIDVTAMILFAGLYDNLELRNAYYVLLPQDGGYRIRWLLWDTDLSFGLYWDHDANDMAYASPMPPRFRREYEALRALYPDLDARIGARWRALRQGVLSEENLLSAAAALESRLIASGALARDRARWGTRYGDADTFDRLHAYFADQLALIDALYPAPAGS